MSAQAVITPKVCSTVPGDINTSNAQGVAPSGRTHNSCSVKAWDCTEGEEAGLCVLIFRPNSPNKQRRLTCWDLNHSKCVLVAFLRHSGRLWCGPSCRRGMPAQCPNKSSPDAAITAFNSLAANAMVAVQHISSSARSTLVP